MAERSRSRAAPWAFLAGIIVGLVALSIAGRAIEHDRLARRFVRFHPYIAPEASYFPAALQLRAILLRREPSPAVIHVIVGGSSVFNGVGQHVSGLWSNRLQALLGDGYLVTNFATRGGGPGDFGLVGMNMLRQLGRRAIYVADGAPWLFSTDRVEGTYAYLTYEAWHRGLLLPWPPRDRALRAAAFGGSARAGEAYLGGALNAVLNFRELWGHVRYNAVSTVYSRLVPLHALTAPLNALSDPELSPEHLLSRAYANPLAAEMELTRRFSRPTPPAVLERLAAAAETAVPPNIPERSLAFIMLNSPYYMNRLTADERAVYGENATATAAALQRAGITAVVVSEGFTDADYHDRTHLTVRGGERLAPIVARHVVDLAARLGDLR